MGECINLDDPAQNIDIPLKKAIRRVIREENWKAANSCMQPVEPRVSFYTKYGKRFLDIVISLVAVIVTLPVNIILAVCTFFDVGWPILFHQERIGKNETVFTLTKFRNMNNEKDNNGDLLPGYLRVSRFGRFVRKNSLDELLNFWSILKGDLSVIGPRPLIASYVYSCTDMHRQRFLVKPGLECPNINGGYVRNWGDQFDNDVWYVENVSLKTDMRMLLHLVRMVFNRKSSQIRGSAVRGSFEGYEKDGRSINSRCVPVYYVKLARERMQSMEEGQYSAYSYM